MACSKMQAALSGAVLGGGQDATRHPIYCTEEACQAEK